jgi:hypothetical protein
MRVLTLPVSSATEANCMPFSYMFASGNLATGSAPKPFPLQRLAEENWDNHILVVPYLLYNVQDNASISDLQTEFIIH